MKVPTGKIVVVGKHRYVEGDFLPPHIIIDMPDEMTVAEADTYAEKALTPKRRRDL